jgi:hypothetical protein
MSLAVAIDLCKTTRSFLNSAFVGTAAGLKLCIAVRAKKAKHLRSIVGVVAIDVIQDRLQGLVIPNERMRVEKTIWVVISLRQRGDLLLTPTKVMPSDGVARCSLNSVAKYVIDSESLLRGSHVYDSR